MAVAQPGAPLPPSATGAVWGPPHPNAHAATVPTSPSPGTAGGWRGCVVRGTLGSAPPQRGRGGRRDALPLPASTSFLGCPWQKRQGAAGQAAVCPLLPASPPPGPTAPRLPPSPPLLCDASRLLAELSAEHGATEPPRPAAALLDRHPLQQYVPRAGGREGSGRRVPLPFTCWVTLRGAGDGCCAGDAEPKAGRGQVMLAGAALPPPRASRMPWQCSPGWVRGTLCPLRGAARVGWVAVALVWWGARVPERSDSSFCPWGAWGPHGGVGDGGCWFCPSPSVVSGRLLSPSSDF